uniref:Uncharacterized protein n=1 Tax=Rhizophora mucronata TaxID=61149 RepID=A0A2P2J5C8_RHIMU
MCQKKSLVKSQNLCLTDSNFDYFMASLAWDGRVTASKL